MEYTPGNPDDHPLAEAWKEYVHSRCGELTPQQAAAEHRGFCGGMSMAIFVTAKLCEASGIEGVMQFVRDLAPELSEYHQRYPTRRR